MALILNVDTATDSGSLALCNEGKLLGMMKNPEPKDHASWIHLAIHELLIKCGYSFENLDAIAITAGPGSYTGLRIGMATAKGLCYVLKIPLVTENTLMIMAAAFLNQEAMANSQHLSAETVVQGRLNNQNLDSKSLLVPMIDARRMEVYTALYDAELNPILIPQALILNVHSFDEWKETHRLICFGNGSRKFEAIATSMNFEFQDSQYDASAMAILSYQHFIDRQFADLAYAEPFYLKEFYSTGKK